MNRRSFLAGLVAAVASPPLLTDQRAPLAKFHTGAQWTRRPGERVIWTSRYAKWRLEQAARISKAVLRTAIDVVHSQAAGDGPETYLAIAMAGDARVAVIRSQPPPWIAEAQESILAWTSPPRFHHG